MNEINEIADQMTASEFLLEMNKWDKQLEDFMKCAENNCHQYHQNHIEWSPIVGVWLKRHWLLNRVQRYLDGKVPDPRNLYRDCRKKGIVDPREITQDGLDVEHCVCDKQLDDLAKKAPALRKKHLKDRHKRAVQKGDSEKASAIVTMLHREAKRKRWRRVKRSVGKTRAVQATTVKIPATVMNEDGDEEEGYEEFKTKDEVCLQVSKKLSELFRRGFSAP